MRSNVSAARHGNAGQTGGRRRVLECEDPPTPVRGRAQHGVPVRRTPRRPRSRSVAVACGVSMPTWTVGPGPATSAWARARRSPSVDAVLGVHPPALERVAQRVLVARAPRRSPASARWHSSNAARQAARVSSSARGGHPAAASMPIVAPSRVFTRPATGALAITSALMSPAPCRSRTPCGRSRGRTRSPSSACRRPGGGRTRRTRSRRQSAACRLAHQLQRVAEPPVADVEGEQVGAAAHPHRGEVVGREAGGAAARPTTTALPSAGVPRPDATGDRPATPEGQVDVPARRPSAASARARGGRRSRRRP